MAAPELQPGLLEEIRCYIEPGDLLLAGGTDRLSRIIRFGTASVFSHVGVALGDDFVVEAWEQKFTPSEKDAGVVKVPLETFIQRDMSHLKVVRPVGLDAARLIDVAEQLAASSAPFPSVGAVVLAACVGSRRLAAVLPNSMRRSLLTVQVRLAGDGSLTMQCAETATRLYLASGVGIWFPNQLLTTHVEHVRDHPDLGLRADNEALFADEPYPTTSLGFGSQGRFSPARFFSHWRERWKTRPDQYDFVLPVDLENSPSFTPVASFERDGTSWRRAGPDEGVG